MGYVVWACRVSTVGLGMTHKVVPGGMEHP